MGSVGLPSPTTQSKAQAHRATCLHALLRGWAQCTWLLRMWPHLRYCGSASACSHQALCQRWGHTEPNGSPWLPPPGTGIPLIPRSAGIRGAQHSGCDFPFFPASVHPHSEFPCENGFEASQEMARSSSGPENFSCSWVCLYNTGTILKERRIPSMTNCCQFLFPSQGPAQL